MEEHDARLATDLAAEFEILRLIGRGSMAKVWLAREKALGRLDAVKVLRTELARDEVARARFEREARAAGGLVHQNVVKVHRVGVLSDGTPYIVMEFVEGRNLTDTLAAEGALTDEEATSVLRQLSAALAIAHAHDIIHRDVRPDNIVWMRESGRAVLMDFGIAAVAESGAEAVTRLTKSGQLLGDPAWMSPEQLRGETVTFASDIYSLGLVGYELLTLGPPYRAASRATLTQAHLNAAPIPLESIRPGTLKPLAELLLRCLSKRPERRPSAAELGRALERTSRPRLAPSGFQALDKVPVLREFFEEMIRRRITRVLTWYMGSSIGFLGAAAIFQDLLRLPVSVVRAIFLIVGIGLPLVLVATWVFEMSGGHIRRTESITPSRSALAHRLLGISGVLLSCVVGALIVWAAFVLS
ncbi:MAG: serine/threonine protein kinase [Gemmatimonadetes bacterium]|nr:serine/threonine protein kinase [Gemmatimonadota bacterium]